ncbi:MAG: L-2-hydroxyglutarate oxidase [Spirochaetes bacterium]|nr:L-2-hydroxyglutarate oxidase [Spirochaetota bacterium]
MKTRINADILICGGGIIGLTIARELLSRGHENIVLIEKEKELGLHASGRNSGVLHAGIYYSTDSLRAKSCLKGNFLMKEYCRKNNLPLNECGKVIVAKNEAEIKTLHELHRRAIANGAKVDLIDEKQLAGIEPNAKTCRQALYSHYTAVVDPKKILKSIFDELSASAKINILMGAKFLRLKGSSTAITKHGEITFKQFINAAGAYSDSIAHSFGVGINFKLIPFKGIYRKLKKEQSGFVRANIYPVPDIRNPFLGVHFTKGISGDVYLGPTAIPAFGRENYGIIKGINFEAIDIIRREIMLLFAEPKFREVAFIEPRKYYFPYFFRDAKSLVKNISPDFVIPSDKAGIRPQLVDWDKKELVQDFKIIKDGDSVHILNAISPAFTGSFDFASFVVNEYLD